MSQPQEQTFHFAGNVYINPYENGAYTGLIGPIDVDSLEIKADAKKNTVQSKKKESYGQARKSYWLSQPAQLTLKTNEIPPLLLAAAFMGRETTINQGSGTLTDLAVTLPAYPKWIQLPKTNLASVGFSVKKGAAELAATDFEVNYALGLLRATAAGTIADGSPVTVSGTHNAVTGTRIEGNVKPAIEAQVLLDGVNLIDNSPMKLDVPLTSLSPKNGVDFLSEKAVEITLEGEVLFKSGETASFYVERPVTA
jgi:hypothetical protein